MWFPKGGVMGYIDGAKPGKGMDASLHSPIFDPDESAFKYGVTATVSYVLTFHATFHYTEAVQLDVLRADLERVCVAFCDLYRCKAI